MGGWGWEMRMCTKEGAMAGCVWLGGVDAFRI